MTIAACSPSQKHDKNRNTKENAGITSNQESDLPPIVEQKISMVDDTFQKVLQDQEKAAQYEAPETAIKNGEDVMYVGYTKLKNVKSIYDRTKHELQVSGLAEIMNADKKTVRVSQEFSIKGKYKAQRGTINLKPTEDHKNANDIQVRAVVTCFKSEINESFDCARAIIDVFIKHKNNYYTEQLESTAFEKPKVIEAKKEVPVEQSPVDLGEVPQTPNNQPPEPQQPVVVTLTPVASKPAIVIDETLEEVDPATLSEVAEGDEDSLAGRYEGKAALVKLAKLFLASKEDKRTDESPNTENTDDDEDQTLDLPVKDSQGRLRLQNQAVGSPDAGRLRNASFLKTHIETYNLEQKIVMANPSPKNYYGTQEMMEILEAIGEKVNTIERNKIFISRISKKTGGELPPSKSHQNGMDVDIGYFTVQGKVQFPIVASSGSIKRSDFSAEKTLEIFKFLMTQKVTPVDRLFVDQAIINNLCREAKNSGKFKGPDREAFTKLFENMQHVDGHGNHFHLRLRCTPNQPDCRHRIYKKMNNCNG